MSEVHRYKVVKMLSEGGNRISYDPHGPEVVMASAYDQLKAEIKAAQASIGELVLASGAELQVDLVAHVAALRKDAQRYRWLKVERRPATDLDAAFNTYGVPVDEAIDAALAREASNE